MNGFPGIYRTWIRGHIQSRVTGAERARETASIDCNTQEVCTAATGDVLGDGVQPLLAYTNRAGPCRLIPSNDARSTSSLSVVHDSDDDVADLVSAVDVPVGVDDLGQGVAAVDDDPEPPLPD